MPIPVHKALVLFCPMIGAFLGLFLGLYLVHGWPVKGEFGWPVVAACASLVFLGFLLPMLLLSRFVPSACPRRKGRAYLRTDSTFLRNPLARYSYYCRACGHEEAADFSRD
jgi:hypothetical protein